MNPPLLTLVWIVFVLVHSFSIQARIVRNEFQPTFYKMQKSSKPNYGFTKVQRPAGGNAWESTIQNTLQFTRGNSKVSDASSWLGNFKGDGDPLVDRGCACHSCHCCWIYSCAGPLPDFVTLAHLRHLVEYLACFWSLKGTLGDEVSVASAGIPKSDYESSIKVGQTWSGQTCVISLLWVAVV